MSFGFAIGDFIAVANLAWQLHQNCYKVIHNCPQEFQELVRDLPTVYGVMKRIEEDYNSEDSGIRAKGERREELLQGMLKNTQETLEKLQKLVHKYQGIATRRSWRATKETFWQKIQWISDRTAIKGIRQDLTFHIATFNLLLTIMGNSSLFRMEQSLSRMHLCSIDAQTSADNTAEMSDDMGNSNNNDHPSQNPGVQDKVRSTDLQSDIGQNKATLLALKMKIGEWEIFTKDEQFAMASAVVTNCPLACFEFY